MSVFFVSWPSKVIHRKLTPLLVEEFLGLVFSIELVGAVGELLWAPDVFVAFKNGPKRSKHSRGVGAFDQVQVAYKLRTAFWCLDFARQNLVGIPGSIPPTSIRGGVPR